MSFYRPLCSRSAVLAGAALMAGLVLAGCKSNVQWRAVAVERGDISVDVTATGTLNPDTQILWEHRFRTIAGAGRFQRSREEGQMLAILDTTFLAARLKMPQPA